MTDHSWWRWRPAVTEPTGGDRASLTVLLSPCPIAIASGELISGDSKEGGLRAVYRTLELPGKNPLKDAHAAPGAAVLAAYGFSPKGDLLAQLLELNLTVAARLDNNQQVTAPGLPPSFPDPQRLITDDCIRP